MIMSRDIHHNLSIIIMKLLLASIDVKKRSVVIASIGQGQITFKSINDVVW